MVHWLDELSLVQIGLSFAIQEIPFHANQRVLNKVLDKQMSQFLKRDSIVIQKIAESMVTFQLQFITYSRVATCCNELSIPAEVRTCPAEPNQPSSAVLAPSEAFLSAKLRSTKGPHVATRIGTNPFSCTTMNSSGNFSARTSCLLFKLAATKIRKNKRGHHQDW
jgi:hypothetical protein